LKTIPCDPLSLTGPYHSSLISIGPYSNYIYTISLDSEATQFFYILNYHNSNIPFSTIQKTMGFRIAKLIRMPSFSKTQESTKGLEVPKGYLAVYVGDKMRRFVIPVSYLNQSLFQELLHQAEEEFGYDHPMGGLTIPCSEDEFQNLTSCLSEL